MGKNSKPRLNIFADAYNAVIEGVEAHNFAHLWIQTHDAGTRSSKP